MPVGVLFTLQPLEPKAERLSPLSGLSAFSSKGLVELTKELFKIGAVVYVTYLTISADLDNQLPTWIWALVRLYAEWRHYSYAGFPDCNLAADNGHSRLFFSALGLRKNLRMTRQEVREVKQQEGDPHDVQCAICNARCLNSA